jgi:hypothetical protein
MEIPRKKRRLLWGIALWFGGALLLAVVALGLLSAPDQFRQIPPPEDPSELSVRAVLSNLSNASVDTQAILTTGALQSSIGTTQSCPSIVLPDLSSWPDERRALAHEWKERADSWLREYATLPDTTNETPMQEAITKCVVAMWAFPIPDPSVFSIEQYCSLVEPYQNTADLIKRARLMRIYVDHERWDCVASIYAGLGDWDKEVYYWRKWGLRGRGMVAVRCAQPLWAPILNEMARLVSHGDFDINRTEPPPPVWHRRNPRQMGKE